MAGDDTPHGTEGEVRMAPLERRARRLLLAYPAAYRRERGKEIVGTLLEATPASRTWPRVRDIRALATGGLKARAAQNRRRSTGTNLTAVVMVGIALYLSFWVSTYEVQVALSGHPSWPPVFSGLLIVATVVLAWVGTRVGALAAALAGSALVVAFGGGPLIGPRLAELLGLGGLVLLARRDARPSWRWLWLPGLIIAASALVEFGPIFVWLSFAVSGRALLGLDVIAVAALVWIAVDARLMVAILTCIAATGLQAAVSDLAAGTAALPSFAFLLVVASLLLPSGWLLRRQSARPAL